MRIYECGQVWVVATACAGFFPSGHARLRGFLTARTGHVASDFPLSVRAGSLLFMPFRVSIRMFAYIVEQGIEPRTQFVLGRFRVEFSQYRVTRTSQ